MTLATKSITATGPVEHASQATQDAQASARRTMQRAWGGYVLALALYAGLFTAWQVEPVPIHVHAAGILLAAICFLPIARWYSLGSRGLPMFELICLSYALQFGSPIYFQYNWFIVQSERIPLTWDATFRSLMMANLGVVMLIAGYSIAKFNPWVTFLPKIDLPLQPQRRTTYIVVAAAIGIGTLTLQTILPGFSNNISVGAIVRLLSSQSYIALIIMAYQVFEGKNRGVTQVLALYLLTTISVLLGLATGLLENALVPLMIIFVVRWHVTRKMPWRFLLAGAILFALLNPVKAEYRERAWFGPTETGLAERITLWFDLSGGVLQDVLEEGDWSQVEATLRGSLSRVDLLHKFVFLQEMTPAFIPYYDGASYDYLFLGWVPRVIWPEKPSASEIHHQIDLDYGLVNAFDTDRTSIGTGLLPEAYINFGLLGIILVMGMQGICFAVLDSSLNGPRSEGGRAIYLTTMIFFLNGIGSAATILFGALFQSVIAFALLLRPFATDITAKPPRVVSGQ